MNAILTCLSHRREADWYNSGTAPQTSSAAEQPSLHDSIANYWHHGRPRHSSTSGQANAHGNANGSSHASSRREGLRPVRTGVHMAAPSQGATASLVSPCCNCPAAIPICPVPLGLLRPRFGQYTIVTGRSAMPCCDYRWISHALLSLVCQLGLVDEVCPAHQAGTSLEVVPNLVNT